MTEHRPRPRDCGITIGTLPTGPHNAITDVTGLRVGHATLAEHCTGVTAIVPDPLESMSVGMAYQGVVEATLREVSDVGNDVVIPVIGECDDSWLGDPSAMAVQPRHVAEAMSNATDGLFEAGAIGAGSGMTCLGWKGGIGTASRVVNGCVLGALVMTNFGALERLCVSGSPVGRRFAELGRSGEREAPEGSCIVVIATDAPILPAQCERVARAPGSGWPALGR